MADYEPPSFSLGFDFDLDLQPQSSIKEGEQASQQCTSPGSLRAIADFDGEGFESPPAKFHDHQVSDPPSTFKRLRRGPVAECSSTNRTTEAAEVWCIVDDEIEQFSSQEDRATGDLKSMQQRSVCGSSKLPQLGHGVITAQSISQAKVKKTKPTSTAPIYVDMEINGSKLIFPKLTTSPVRRFQLIDSDSDTDDTSVSEDISRDTNNVYSSPEARQFNCGQLAALNEQRAKAAAVSMHQTENLWKDFCPNKSFHIPTPALDEFCAEYFASAGSHNEARNIDKGVYMNTNTSRNNGHPCDSIDPPPPAHRYFFHEDSRIQNLVRSRLPYFFPLDSVNSRGHKQPSASAIDYMNQFSHGESGKQAARKNKSEISSRKSRSNAKLSSANEKSLSSGRWVSTKCCDEIPKDAGKRRVHAVGQSTGHWYTDSDGRRVYVTKSGQELTGQTAYRNYKKESSGFRKSKKKNSAKKTTAKGTGAKKTTEKRTTSKKK